MVGLPGLISDKVEQYGLIRYHGFCLVVLLCHYSLFTWCSIVECITFIASVLVLFYNSKGGV